MRYCIRWFKCKLKPPKNHIYHLPKKPRQMRFNDGSARRSEDSTFKSVDNSHQCHRVTMVTGAVVNGWVLVSYLRRG